MIKYTTNQICKQTGTYRCNQHKGNIKKVEEATVFPMCKYSKNKKHNTTWELLREEIVSDTIDSKGKFTSIKRGYWQRTKTIWINIFVGVTSGAIVLIGQKLYEAYHEDSLKGKKNNLYNAINKRNTDQRENDSLRAMIAIDSTFASFGPGAIFVPTIKTISSTMAYHFLEDIYARIWSAQKENTLLEKIPLFEKTGYAL